MSDSSPIVHSVLFIAIPVHNEVETIGVLLWRLRSVLAEFPRDYEVVVYDDASTDGTHELLEGYAKVLPLTVLRGERQVGYAQALDHLLRHAVTQTRHPRRDAVLLLQGDFTDPPGLIPEFARRFEGGADLVVGERTTLADAPVAVQRLFRLSGWSMRPFVRIDGLQDVTSSLRLVRIATVRDLLRERGDAPLVEGDSWTANADLLLRLVPYARRVETVPVQSTYGVRVRETRRVAARDAMAALKWAWAARKRRVKVLAAEVEPSRTRDEPRLTLTRNDSDDRGTRARNRGTEERTARVRTHADEEERAARRARRDREGGKRVRERPVAVAPAASNETTIDDESAIAPDAQREERRRKRRKRGAKRTPVIDTAAETLSLVDPAAGSAPDLELVEDANDVSADDADAVQRPRRKKRRRRKRSRDVNGETAQSSDGEGSGNNVDSDSPYREVRDESDASERDGDFEGPGDVEGSGEGDGDGAGGDSDAARARRRGRRGRRGGRRTRRNRDINGTSGDSDSVDTGDAPRSDSDGSSSDRGSADE